MKISSLVRLNEKTSRLRLKLPDSETNEPYSISPPDPFQTEIYF